VTPLKPVQGSSQIAAYGYDAASQVLAVQFMNSRGFIYQYREVPPEVAAEFEKAESKGKAFGALVRNRFDFNRIEVGEPADAEG